MTDPWDKAMRGLSDLELRLIMQGAKNGSLNAVGAPENAFGAGLKAAMELNRRDSDAARSAETEGLGSLRTGKHGPSGIARKDKQCD